MQHDFTLAANASITIDVAGRFFKYKSGTGLIRVRDSKGQFVDLLPGQGVWGIDYTSLTITDKTGAANAGVILAGAFDFHDDRITGTVDVLDGGKTRTISGIAFAGAIKSNPLAAQYSTCQLWNPVGSGKNVYVSKVFLSSDIGGIISIGTNNAANSAVLGSGASKKASGGLPTAQNCPTPIAGVPANFQYLGQVILAANVPFIYQFSEPVMMPPGFGLNTQHITVGTPTVSTTFEFIEEVI